MDLTAFLAIAPATPLVCSAPAASALPGGILKGLDGATLYDVLDRKSVV